MGVCGYIYTLYTLYIHYIIHYNVGHFNIFTIIYMKF